ncbi:endolytic transglycosylase MltG [bacterium (Candidatus Torokbacteria) CG09_land_8_20_14_0_10_42_11]|nr:MAG: endolytic transglycosylase MltG [bacterium (Candidatus Torokbacteria) CG09_land_8_20_14_0_10_42_11]
MKNYNAKLKILTIALSLFFVALLIFGYIEWQIRRPFSTSDLRAKEFTIAEGESVDAIASNLEEQDLISDKRYFKIYVWQKGLAKSFQAGDFTLCSGFNIPQIAKILTGKPESREADITIIEGWDRRDIDQYLGEKKLIIPGDFIAATQKMQGSIFENIASAPAEASLEGFLFPDTYRVYKDAKPDEILKKMLANFQDKINPLLPEIEKQNKNLYEILTLASIVEKEAAKAGEMPLIAGVFNNRLLLGRPLESDATVNYATGKKLRQPIYDDLQTDSRYNTYRYAGLPPGPICNPSLAAILAAISPEATDYLYFLHPENGGTVFAKNLEEHKRNREQYLDGTGDE